MYYIPIVFKMVLSFLDEHRFGQNSTVNTLTRKVSFQIKSPGHVKKSIKKEIDILVLVEMDVLQNLLARYMLLCQKTLQKW